MRSDREGVLVKPTEKSLEIVDVGPSLDADHSQTYSSCLLQFVRSPFQRVTTQLKGQMRLPVRKAIVPSSSRGEEAQEAPCCQTSDK